MNNQTQEPWPQPWIGITWATQTESIAQTAYIFSSVDEAVAAAKLGHDKQPEGTQVDPMGKVESGEMVYAMIETIGDTIKEIEVGIWTPTQQLIAGKSPNEKPLKL